MTAVCAKYFFQTVLDCRASKWIFVLAPLSFLETVIELPSGESAMHIHCIGESMRGGSETSDWRASEAGALTSRT